MSILEHYVLFVFLFLIMHAWGNVGSRVKNVAMYWILALIPMFCYCFIVGSRYGWGADYLFYKYRLENAFTYKEEQIVFKWLNQAIAYVGLNYVGGYIIYSLIYVVCAFVLMRSYKVQSRFMYSFFVPATLIFVTSIIRQGLALAFVYLSIYFLFRKNWLGLVISVLIGINIHTSILITYLVLFGFYFFVRQPFNWRVTIPIYIFFAFFFDYGNVTFISPFINKYIVLNSAFQSYVENADLWFGNDGLNTIYQQGTFTLIMSSLFYIAVIYIGYYALKMKPSPEVLFLYNAFVFGVIFFRAVFLFEILRRIAEPFVMFYFVVLGYSIFVFSSNIKKFNRLVKVNKIISSAFTKRIIIYRVFIAVIVVYLFMFWGRFVFMNPEATFYWNK
ncbi:EpsG family protein [Emticicia sp. 21SJ11W-3]|uniref:EpsG family protein n=1 Tax=Emticicia sp. 21SJ11W-3 TaxID=2916755 RepID=UPI0020A0920B|nr:EpsG family protein [Emticicia sp. 21SJ11W-3]UTA68668.1 EpsG family protein [Emticicia sp. 21SJ11W-3]